MRKFLSKASHCLLNPLLPSLLTIALLQGCAFFGASPDVPPPPPSVKANKILRCAYGQMGKKYRAGGASPQKGFDCSGLVWWSYKENGIKIPRISVDQAKIGKSIPKHKARAGDIVVFKTGQSPRGLHTGLYAGDGCFIHSPGTGKRICMEKMSLPHWKNSLVAVRRVLANPK